MREEINERYPIVLSQELTDKLKYFEKDLVESALQIEESNRHEEEKLVRKRRSFPITDGIHHAYIFDILPDRIDELFIDGTTHYNIAELNNCKAFHFLPVLKDHKFRRNLLIVQELNQISFYVYNSFEHKVTEASVALTSPELWVKSSDATILEFVVVTKKVERLDLDRLAIVSVYDKHGYYIRVFEIDFKIPDNPAMEKIFKKVSSVGIQYMHHQKVLDLDAIAGDAINYQSPTEYRVWMAALVRNSNTSRVSIDVYTIENMNGHYRYSVEHSYNCFSPTVSKIYVLKIFEFIAVVETDLDNLPFVVITYFVEHNQIRRPYQTKILLQDSGSITDIEYFTYGSRAFFLLSTSTNKQVIKEVFSYGNRLLLEEFATINVPYGKKWLVVDVPGCRDEKIIYLFYEENGVTQVFVAKFTKTGLVVVSSPGTVPVYYLAPDEGYFSSFGQVNYYNKDEARQACIQENTCAGIHEVRGKNHVFGYQTGLTPNSTIENALFKKKIQDGADLFLLLSNSDPDFENIYSFAADGQGHLIIKLLSGDTVVVDIVTHTEIYERKVVLENAEIYNKLRNLTAIVEEHESVINRTKEVLENAVQPDENQSFTNQITVNNFTGHPRIVTENITTWNVDFENSSLTVEDLTIGIDDLLKNITEIHESLDELLEKLEDAILKDERANITGTKWFQGLINITQQLNSTYLQIDQINGNDITKLLNETYRRDHPKPIDGHKTYETTVKVEGDVITETLNGLNVSEDIVTINTDQIIHGETVFLDPVKITVDVDVNDVNGIDISEEAIPLDSNKTVFSSKNFTEWVSANTVYVEKHGTIDGVDISKLASNVLTIDGNETVHGTLVFLNTVVVTNNVVVGTVSGVNISGLNQIAARINEITYITGDKIFNREVYVNNEIILDGYLNGLNTSDIFVRTKPQYFTAEKYFFTLKVNDIYVQGKVSGIDLPYDIVTLTTDQVITGKHYFTEGITVNGSIIINGTVDEVDISELKDRAISLSNKTIIQGDITFTSQVNITDTIIVNGTVNDFDLGAVFEDIVYDFEENVTISAEKYFENNLNCSDKFVVNNTVNNFTIPDDFVDVFSNQNISGHKTFEYIKFNKDLNVKHLIDGINITDLFENAVTLTTDQNITSELSFTDGIHLTGHIIVSEHRLIDNFDVSNHLVSRTMDVMKIVRGKKVIQGDVVTEFLHVFNSVECDHINGVDVSELAKHRITLHTNQEIGISSYFGDNIIDNFEVNGLINGINLTEFSEDVMSLTKNQWVTGDKAFTGHAENILVLSTLAITDSQADAEAICADSNVAPENCKVIVLENGQLLICDALIFDSLTLTNILNGHAKSNGINGFNLYAINRDAIKIFNNSIVTANFTFVDDFWANSDLHLTGFIDGVNLTELYLYAVRKNSNGQYIGDKIFNNGFHVEGNIEFEVVNGFRVPDDTFTVNTDQVIEGTYTFVETVEVESSVRNTENITVCKQSDPTECVSFDLSDFASNVARIDQDQTIEGILIFSNMLMVAGNIIQEGFIDGEDILFLYNNAIFNNGANFDDGNLIIFSNETIMIYGDIITNSLNGNNFMDLVNRTLRINSTEFVNSSKTFNHVKIDGTLKTSSLDVDGLIDGVNVTDLADNAVYIDRNQVIEGNFTFEQTVFVNGDLNLTNVNGIDISEDVVTLNTTQTIYGSKHLHKVIFNEDVEVKGLVNGYNLTELFNDTLMIVGDQSIDGYKNINSATFNHLRCATVNGMNTDTYVTLTTEQTLESILIFDDLTTFKSLYVNGTINGESITEIEENALYLNETENVTAAISFEEDVTFYEDVTIGFNKTIDGVDLDVLYYENENFRRYISKSLENITDEHKDTCLSVSALHNVVEESAFYIDYRKHPFISDTVPPLSHLFLFDSYYLGLKRYINCQPSDLFHLPVGDFHSNSFSAVAAGFNVGNVVEIIRRGEFLLVHKNVDIQCQASYISSVLIETTNNLVINIPTQVNPSKLASMLVTEDYVFISFTFDPTSFSSTKVYKLDRNTQLITSIINNNNAFTNFGHFFEFKGTVYFIEILHSGTTSIIYFSYMINNFSKLKIRSVHSMPTLQFLKPIITEEKRIYFVSYLTKQEQTTYYKVTSFPQQATFTLFKFNPRPPFGKSPFTPVQYLSVEFNSLENFSVTLGGTTIHYLLFIKDTSIDIYIFEGVACYQLNGIIDLAPKLDDGEFITFTSVNKEQKIPALIVQTSRDQTFYFDAVTNGYALSEREINCHY